MGRVDGRRMLLGHRADGGRDGDSHGGDVRANRAVGNLRRTLGDGLNLSGVDG